MATSGSPTVRRRQLGMRLRQYRTDRRLTGATVASELQRNPQWVSRIEAGQSGIRLAELRALLDLYQVTDPAVRTELEDLARHGRERGWWSKYASVLSSDYAAYIGFEAEASRLLVYESLLIHGLLQTEDYARVVIKASSPTATEETIERRVQVRMRRQELLTRDPSPLEMWAVFDEAVLHRVVAGNIAAHVAQLDRLLEVAKTPTIRLQVVPFKDASNPGATAGFTVLEYQGGADRIAYIEGLTSDVYEEGDAAERLTLGHENLRAAALSEASSIALIERVRDEVAR